MSDPLSIGWRPEELYKINVTGSEEKELIFKVIAEIWKALSEKVKDGYSGKENVILKIEHWKSSTLSEVVRKGIEEYFSSFGWVVILGWTEGHIAIAPNTLI